VARRAAAALLAAWTAAALPVRGEPAPAFTLLDAQGRVVAEARVAVVGKPGSVRTDARGTFRLDPSLRPPLELAVFDAAGTFLGVLILGEADWEAGAPLRLEPEPSAEITVRAGLAPATEAPPAAAATLHTRADREREAPERLVDQIASVPGVGKLDEGQTGVPTVRGLARGRTLILLDDGRVTAERRAGPSATFLDPFLLESVEVVRGPGSVAYGSDAIGGVIHARTARPTPGEWGGRFEIGAGVGQPCVGGGAAVNVPVGAGAFLLQARARSFDDYDAPGGTVPNTAAEDRGAALRGLFPFQAGTLDLGIQIDTARDVGKPTSPDVATLTSYPREDSTRFRAAFAFDPAGGFDSIDLGLFAGTYRLVTRRDRPASGAVLRQIQDADVDANDASVRASATRGIGEGVLRFGVDAAGRFGLEAIGTTASVDAAGNPVDVEAESSIEDASRLALGAFTEVEHPVTEWMELSGGVRYDRVRTENRGGWFGDRSTSQGTATGFAAATLGRGSARSATLQVARGFRDPSLSDRYFRGVTGRGFATGNPDLLPETSLQWDLSLRSTVPNGHVAFYAYRYRIFDLVERYREGNDFFFRNRGEQRMWGLELEADLAPAPRWTIRAGASWVRGRIEEDRSPAADIPPPTATLAVGRVHDRFDWEVRAYGVLRKDDPGPTETTTPGYGIFGASLRVPVTRGFELRLRADNLLDHTYPGSADEAAAVAAGRSVGLTLAGAF
jgi:hemoglobin/transferrin/lactoferrin receptor protein